ncbi:hypothetical protein EON66_07070 [archaeon]|nr:MAG: hypothetical protein EON66_07070 [archaeon]
MATRHVEHSGPILVMIVAAGACLDTVDARGETPLMRAVTNNFLLAKKYSLKLVPHSHSGRPRTPARLAASWIHGGVRRNSSFSCFCVHT